MDAARLYGRSSGTFSRMGRLHFAGRLRSRTRTVANDQLIEERIRARAHRLWEEEGRPEGRAEAHWEQARLIVALEDAQHTILKPVQAPEAEPIELVRKEFPTPTDQGEEQTKEQTYPSSSSTAGEPLMRAASSWRAIDDALVVGHPRHMSGRVFHIARKIMCGGLWPYRIYLRSAASCCP